MTTEYDSEERVTVESANYLLFVEPVKDGGSMERLSTLREVAMYVIDGFDYYLSNSTMNDLAETLKTGRAASIELPNETTLTVVDNRDPKAMRSGEERA
ncbi:MULTISPECIES: hypothetical protein [unclassified Streptomyces]|uniref:hypothetical protein n=1 Tax=Streptomyces sp. NPDC056835 TaxID=3345956 RepID=UPI0036A3022C